MTIETGTGNLLTTDVEALVNTVNTEGVMGKGLALQFKKTFPDAFKDYERAAAKGEIVIGKMHVVERLTSPRFIVNFPTKALWRQPSRIAYIQEGLNDLRRVIETLGIRSIAVPPLGCGLGGLDWAEVRPLIESVLGGLSNVRVVLFAPVGAPTAGQVIDRRRPIRMTQARAALIALMARYRATGYDYPLALVEVQKLAYFLQVAGENLRLEFAPNHFGPYADGLRKALRNMEDHFTRGLGDGQNSPETAIELMKGAVEAANETLAAESDVKDRFERVERLIDGFETPFGMELLATVHWVTAHNPQLTPDEVVMRVHAWNSRKRAQMRAGHILAALDRLRSDGWLLAEGQTGSVRYDKAP